MKRVLFIAALAILVLRIQGQAVTPKVTIPTAYSVVISVNSNQNGFTYAFTEYYDTTLNMWRTDANQTTNVYDFNKVCARIAVFCALPL
jgi:hypothetical protein